MEMTVYDVLKEMTGSLQNAGIPDAEFDAKQLVAATLQTHVANLPLIKTEEMDEKFREQLKDWTRQRMAHRPLQYIIGEWEFYGLPFFVGEGVLIPRQDTEALVETALEFIQKSTVTEVIDVCSGSGCVAVSIEKNAPNVQVTAIELFDVAYDYTVRNIQRNGCDRITAVQQNLFDGPKGLTADLIVSNPPYIPKKDLLSLSQEVGKEPVTALDGGVDGLDFYRGLCDLWIPALRCGGALMVEVGFDQGEVVAELFKSYDLQDIGIKKDLCGVARVVYGIKM